MSSKKLKTLGLASALVISSGVAKADSYYQETYCDNNGCTTTGSNYELTGQEKIDQLIASINNIQGRIQTNGVMTVGAVGYAAIGGVIEDNALNEGLITSEELGNYLNAKELVLNHDYAVAETAEQMFMQEHAAAMNSLTIAIDTLTDATSVVMTAVEVASVAAEADTKPEQVELQGMLATDEFSLDTEEVNTYNEAVVAVEVFAQQAGAFMAAANNEDLTSTVDSYAAQGSFLVGTYTAISYTQSMDEFVIAWDDSGFGTGFQGYLTPDFKNAEEVFGAGEYINEYGGYPTQ
jgi:hypothetical protein